MKASGSEESEIKIPVADLGLLRARLSASGAERISEKHEEQNVLFDDSQGRLSAAHRTLRLRRARGRAVLTYKGPPAFQGPVKRREELEVEVPEPDTLERIIERLGFVARFRYEKRREEFRWRAFVVALDETPIGSFVEIEGDADGIAAAAASLGLDPDDSIRESYPGLYRLARRRDPRLPADMLFSESPR